MIYSKRKKLHEEVNALAIKYGCKIIRCSLDLDVLDIQFKLPETIITPENKKLTELDIKFERYGFTKINSFYNDSKYAKVIGSTRFEFVITKPDGKIHYSTRNVLHGVDTDSLLGLEFFQIEKFEKFLKDREIIDKDFTVIEKFVFNPIEYGFKALAFRIDGKFYVRFTDNNIIEHCFIKRDKDEIWQYTKTDFSNNNDDEFEIRDLVFKSSEEVDAFLIKQRIYYRRVKVK